MSFIVEFFKKVWTLPQTLFGYLLVVLFRAKRNRLYKDAVVYSCTSKWFSGVSLGQTIILEDAYFKNEKYVVETIKHEYGHTIQSYIFGPLYLVVIGLPSITNNIIARFSPIYHRDYYNKYPEKWADKLGGVERVYK